MARLAKGSQVGCLPITVISVGLKQWLDMVNIEGSVSILDPTALARVLVTAQHDFLCFAGIIHYFPNVCAGLMPMLSCVLDTILNNILPTESAGTALAIPRSWLRRLSV